MVAQEGGRIVGFSACFLTDSKVALEPHTFREITGLGTFQTHRPGGDTLYGAEIMVHPEHRRHGIAKLFYRARFELARRLGVRYFVAGGRIPGYGDHKGRMSAEQYVAKVVSGELADRVLSAQLASGLKVRRILPNYLNDPKSLNYATLLVWENPEGAPRATAQRRRRPTHVGPGKVSR